MNNYKICFFTEANFRGKYPANHKNARTDVAWQIALDAEHVSIHTLLSIDFQHTNKYDIGIVILPKKGNNFDTIVTSAKQICKKVAVMQEGSNNYWQDYDVYNQADFFNALKEADFILCHNVGDKDYYVGLLNSSNVYRMPSLLLESYDLVELRKNEKNGVIIGGNMCSWYGGFDSMVIAREFDEQIYVPSMGRKVENEEKLWSDCVYLSYLNWSEWMKELSTKKYAVHLMRTFAAGTFALNCAYFGIPCIGYSYLDTQRILHPNTSVDFGDLHTAKKIAKSLKEDEDFYKDCVEECIANYYTFFAESKFSDRMKTIFNRELNA